MKFYSSIAQNYDYIFPVKQVQIDFIKSIFAEKTKLVEIGSGTGNLTIALANEGYSMSGLEYDKNMLDLMKNMDRVEKSETFEAINADVSFFGREKAFKKEKDKS